MKNKKKISFFLTMMGVLLSSVPASAGEPYITFKDRITVRASGIRPSLNLTVERDSDEIIFLPNTMVNGKVGVSYRGFGFSFGTEIDGSQKDELEYGKTEYIDYQLKYFMRNLGFVAYFQKYGGGLS
jgi:hypothetical protein